MISLSDVRPEIFIADTVTAVQRQGTVEQMHEIGRILNEADRCGMHRFWHCNPAIFRAIFVFTQHRLLGNNGSLKGSSRSMSVAPSCAVFCPCCETWLASPEHLFSHIRPDPLTSSDFAAKYLVCTWGRWCQVMSLDTLNLWMQKNIASPVVMPQLFNNSMDTANAAQVAFIIKLGHSPALCPRCKVWLAHPWYIETHEENPSRCYLARRAALVGVDKPPFKTNALIHVAGSVSSMMHVPRSRTLFRMVSRAVSRPKLLRRAHAVLNTVHLPELLHQHPHQEKLHSILIETGWIETLPVPANNACFQGTNGLTKLVRMHLKLMDAMPWLV